VAFDEAVFVDASFDDAAVDDIFWVMPLLMFLWLYFF
jgi:hypothetical protein